MGDNPQEEGKKPTGEETPTKKEAGSKEAGAEKNKAADFIQVEGLGKFSAEDVKNLKTAQVGLDKSLKDKQSEIEKLSEKIKELENKNLSEKEREDAKFQKMKEDIENQQRALIRAHVTLALKKKGLDISADALNIEVNSLEEVESAVEGFLESNPALKKAAETMTRDDNIPTPDGRENGPGGAPPATDEEQELIDAYNNPNLTAEQKRDLDKRYNNLKKNKGGGSGRVI